MLFDLQIFGQKEKVILFLELPDINPVRGLGNYTDKGNNGNNGNGAPIHKKRNVKENVKRNVMENVKKNVKSIVRKGGHF